MEYGTARTNINNYTVVDYLIFTNIDDADIPFWAKMAMMTEDIVVDESHCSQCAVKRRSGNYQICESGDVIIHRDAEYAVLPLELFKDFTYSKRPINTTSIEED